MIFINNKYHKWYFNIIESAKQEPPIGYSEKHHIVPKSLGGSDDPSNLVLLTARQHFICHRLLYKMVVKEHKSKMFFAYWMMFHSSKTMDRYNPPSRLYEDAKIKLSKMRKNVKRPRYVVEKVSKALKGRTQSAESNRKRSEAHKGRVGSMTGRKHSEETKRKMSLSRTGKKASEETKAKLKKARAKQKFSDETRRKMSESAKKRTGRVVSDETRRKISESSKGRKQSAETRRKMSENGKGKKMPPRSPEHIQALKDAWARRKANKV